MSGSKEGVEGAGGRMGGAGGWARARLDRRRCRMRLPAVCCASSALPARLTTREQGPRGGGEGRGGGCAARRVLLVLERRAGKGACGVQGSIPGALHAGGSPC
jgi:hypothetical protein